MKTLAALLVCLMLALGGAAGCKDDCEKACDHLEECGVDTGAYNCECTSDTDECLADCLNDATCDEINYGDALLDACLTACSI